MKNKVIVHGHEEARIYKNHYKPSLNVLRLLRSVIGIFISGQTVSAHDYKYRRK